jgi:hypothetical protein
LPEQGSESAQENDDDLMESIGISLARAHCRDNILTAQIPLFLEADYRQLALHADNEAPGTTHKCGTFCAENWLLISHHQTPSSLQMSRTFCRESLFHHMKD